MGTRIGAVEEEVEKVVEDQDSLEKRVKALANRVTKLEKEVARIIQHGQNL